MTKYASIMALPLFLGACADLPPPTPQPAPKLDAAISEWVNANGDQILAALRKSQAQTNAQQAAASTSAIEAKINAAGLASLHPEDAPKVGRATSPPMVAYFYDPTCSAARASAPELAAFIAANPNVKITYRPIPIIHPNEAIPIVKFELAVAQLEPAKFLAVHNEIMSGPVPDAMGLKVIATRYKLNIPAVEKLAASPDIQARLDANLAYQRQIGITGTPTYWINGKIFVGGISRQAIADAAGAKSADSTDAPSPKTVAKLPAALMPKPPANITNSCNPPS